MTLFDGQGRRGYLSREQEAALSTRLSERLMHDRGEVAACIAATWAVIYGRSGCLKLLRRLGFEYKRPESLPARADEVRQAALIATYDRLGGGRGDLLRRCRAPGMPVPPGAWLDPEGRQWTSGRQRLNLHAALNLEN